MADAEEPAPGRHNDEESEDEEAESKGYRKLFYF
jgi:hypothetical protein